MIEEPQIQLPQLLDSAESALRAGDWAAARDAFETVLERPGSGAARSAAHDGLGRALGWRERAGARAAGSPEPAHRAPR